MTHQEAEELIMRALADLNEELEEDERVPVGSTTSLFGADSRLDSLALVSLIVDIESALSERLGKPVSLTDDKAMSRETVPFTTVKTLADYIVELSAE